NHTNCPLTDLGGKTCIFSHPVYLFLREFSLQDFRGGSMNREEASLFFRLLNRRYEKASIILTSNKGFADWGEMFGEHVLATAILDRLLHHSTTLNIKGESYRFNIPDRLVVHLSLHARPELRAHNT
ncbi:ATP-binding protein, partial [Escherichia coli]|uniref:ATP-binding protein n=4 Tax=Escherichia coli TaxID=562 RepID=UPI00201ADB18